MLSVDPNFNWLKQPKRGCLRFISNTTTCTRPRNAYIRGACASVRTFIIDIWLMFKIQSDPIQNCLIRIRVLIKNSDPILRVL